MNKLNLYATTIEQSKRLVLAGVPDETADMRYMWMYTQERPINFFKKKRVSNYDIITRFQPCIGIMCDSGDIDILDVYEQENVGEELETIYKNDKETVSLRITTFLRPQDIPSWSLTALLNLCPYGGLQHVSDKWYFSVKGYDRGLFDTPIEAAVDVVCWFMEKGIITPKTITEKNLPNL